VEQSGQIRVLIVDDIPETRENLRKLLSFAVDIEVVGAAATGEEGIQLAKETHPHVVLMDINLPGMDGITATEHIVREVPAAQVVILSVQGESGYMRRAMAAGARDFLVKPPSGDELMDTIRRAYEIGLDQAARIAPPSAVAAVGPEGERPGKRGQLVVVFAPKGGVGCTTVAVNLALAFQARLGSHRKIAIFDANLQFGDVGVMLNLQPARSVADLAEHVDDLDSDLLTSTLTPHPSGVKALLAPPHPEAAEPLLMSGGADEGVGGRTRTIVEALLREFDLVLVDTWSWMDDVALTLLDEAELILLVITPLLPDVKDARHFVDLASRLNYPEDKLALVINHADRRGGIRLEQIEKVLMPAIGRIPFDERAGLLAANRGTPIVSEETGKPIAQAFVHLAAAVLERLEELAVPEEGVEWASVEASQQALGRIFGS